MFVTADSIVTNMFDPQALNRYSYCRNNPLIYVDPSGHTLRDTNTGSNNGADDDKGSIKTDKAWEKAGLDEIREQIIQKEKIIEYILKQLFPEFETIKKAVKPAQQQAIIEAAKKYLGMKYGWGQNGKNKKGIDCSHLVENAYKAAGLDYSYSTTKDIDKNTDLEKVENPSVFNQEKGDIVNYGDGPGTQGHMGLYDPDSPDDNKSVLSATTSKGVRYGKDDWFTGNYDNRDVYRFTF